MATLKDVAKRAGVSVSTISYVLNGRKKVKDETVERINEAVRELGYSPNRVARGLKTSRTSTIGVVVTDLDNLFFVDVIRAIENTAHENGYNVILCNSNNSVDREKEHLTNLIGQSIDGMILAGTGKHRVENLLQLGIPVVTVDRNTGIGNGSVVVDNVYGGQLAAQYLIDKGKAPIAIFTFSRLISTFFDRVYGYRKILEANGVEYDENLVVETEFGTYYEGYYAAIELMKRKVEFRSLFACNDLLALGAMRAFIESGLNIPEDVAVIGYDDIQISKIFIPSLTTVAQPIYEMGVSATNLLLGFMRNEEIKENVIRLAPEIIIRESA